MDAGSSVTIKPEAGSPTGCGVDRKEDDKLLSVVNIKPEKTFIKAEIASPDFPEEFGPVMDVGGSLHPTAGGNCCTNNRVKVEDETSRYKSEENCSSPAGPAVKLEPESGRGVPYTDIDILHSDVKLECSEYSKNVDQRIGGQSNPQDSIIEDSTVPLIASGRRPELKNLRKTTAKKAPRMKLTHKGTQTNTDEKIFSCSLCSHTTFRSGSLKIHMITHTGEKPFSCSYCTYTCGLKGQLVVHERSHTGVKPCSCPRCSYACTTKGRLKNHMLVHTG